MRAGGGGRFHHMQIHTQGNISSITLTYVVHIIPLYKNWKGTHVGTSLSIHLISYLSIQQCFLTTNQVCHALLNTAGELEYIKPLRGARVVI